jgi:hypothetical protein
VRPGFFLRHDRILLGAALLLALVGFGAWWVLQDRTAHSIRSTTSTCTQVDRLYTVVVKLMQSDGGFTAAEVAAMRKQRSARLSVQGCR